ncbi:hypothetical protein RB600_008368 [Gaeumannomyces tritici]
MSSSSKPRQPRLRASCDGCFLAKVKCSKARPICSRCLACGIECRYSPSIRSGKPKSDHNSGHHSSSASDMSGLSPVGEDKTMLITTHVSAPGLYRIDTGWNTPPAGVEGTLSRDHSIASGLALLGVDERAAREAEAMAAAGGPDMYSTGMPWTPPNDMSAPGHFPEPTIMAPMPQSHGHGRSQSFDVAMSTAGVSHWAGHTVPHDMFGGYGQTHMPTPASMANYFPSPSSTPTLRPQVRNKAGSTGSISGGGGSCTCFTACLQSLQALHDASAPSAPPFDIVLSMNRKAVEGCAAMLSCQRCMSRSGTHTAAMLLATVIGKITSFYKNASQTHFENGGMGGGTGMGMPSTSGAPGCTSPTLSINGNFGISLGAYQIGGEDGRWIELEILARELRKLEEVYSRFREVFADLSEDPEISRAMIGYLSQNLGSTLDVVSHRKGDMGFA